MTEEQEAHRPGRGRPVREHTVSAGRHRAADPVRRLAIRQVIALALLAAVAAVLLVVVA